MKHVNILIALFMVTMLGGCGWFGGRAVEPVNIAQPIQLVEANQAAIDYMTKVITKYAETYPPEVRKELIQAQGALYSILEYALMLNKTGQATVCNTETVWNQAQVEYYRLVSIIDTTGWEEPEKIVYQQLNREVARLAAGVDYSLSLAGDNADRKTMDNILGQVQMVFSTVLPLMM